MNNKCNFEVISKLKSVFDSSNASTFISQILKSKSTASKYSSTERQAWLQTLRLEKHIDIVK